MKSKIWTFSLILSRVVKIRYFRKKMRRNQRNLFFYDLTILRGKSVHARVPSLAEIEKVLVDAKNAGTAQISRDNGTLFYSIGDISKDRRNSILKVLVHRSDLMAADAAYRNVKTGVRKVHAKGNDEGGETAAHLAISLTEETGRPGVYSCVLEGVQGISHRFVQQLVNGVLAQACRANKSTFTYSAPFKRDKAGNPLKVGFLPKVVFKGRPSDDFLQDLEEGTLTNIELVADRGKAQFGGSPFLAEARASLKVSVEGDFPAENRWETIKTAVNTFMRGRRDYSAAKISFKDPRGKTHTVNFGIDLGAHEQEEYIKCVFLNRITPPLSNSCPESIVPHFMNTMVGHLLTERNI